MRTILTYNHVVTRSDATGAAQRRLRPTTALVARVAVVAVLAACGGNGSGDSAAPDEAVIDVVAAFAPIAEVARRVGGGAVEVRDLTPPGVEPHDLELAPDDLDAILDADLVVVLGGGFQPAVEDAMDRRAGPTLVVLDAPGVVGGAAELAGLEGDAHVWLDPTRLVAIADAVEEALGAVDAAGAASFAQNALTYTRELGALDAEIESGLEDCDRRLLVTAHSAFGWFADRYGLEAVGVAGISPDAEPDPRRLAELADLAVDEGVTTIFTESQVSSEIAETLAREAGGIRTAVLNPFEVISDEERAAGSDYAAVMRENLALLREGLGCR